MKKNKKLISIILTSLMIFSIVATSLVPTISSYAQDMGSFVDKYDLTTEDILSSSSINADLDNPLSSGQLRMFVPNKPYGNLYDKSGAVANCLDSIYLNFDNEVTYDDSLFLSLSLQNDYLTTFVFPQGSFLNCNYSTVDICIPVTSGVNTIYGSTWETYSNVFSNGSNVLTDNNHAHVTIDDVEYYVIENVWSENWVYIYLCNAPIYSFENINNVTTLEGAQQINNSNAFNNASNAQKNKDIANHLTLRDDTKFYISNTSFDNGTLYLYPVLDQTQLGKDESLDEYYFRLVGSVNTTTTYNKNNTEYYAKAPNGSRITNCFPMSVTGSNPYNFTLSSSDGYYYDFPVKDAVNGQWSMSLSDLNDKFMSNTDYSYHYLAYGYDSLYSGTSVFNTVDYAMSGLSIMGNHFDSTKALEQQSKCDIVPNSVYYHIDLYIVKKNIQTDEMTSSQVQSYIDGDICIGTLSGTNVNTSSDEDIKKALGTDYVPSGYASTGTNTNYKDTYNNVGGSGGSASGGSSDNNSSNSTTGGSASIGDGAIVINNNPTFNNDVSSSSASSSSGFGGFLSTLITLIANGKTSSVDTISSISGTTGYTNLVNTYLSTVPTSFWNVIIVTMTALLGISVIAFIIGLLFKIFF